MIILEDAKNPSPVAVKLKKYLELYDDALGFADWQIYVRYTKVEKRKKWDAKNFKADCDGDPEYYKAFLRFDLELLSGKTDDDLSRFVRHELIHAKLWWLCEFAAELCKTKAEQRMITMLEERTVSDLERMPIMGLDG